MASDDASEWPAELPDAVLRYADHRDGVIDLFLPPSYGQPAAASSLLLLVHGGFWREAWDRRHLRPLAAELARRGFVVALPEYRRVGGLGGWPQTAYDVGDALAAAPSLIEAAAPGRIDAGAPTVVAGHSAGGHLALWAGLRAAPGAVARIVPLAPVSDVLMAAETDMGGGAAQALLGGEPDDVPDRYAAADVLPLLPGQVAVTVVQGSDDREVTVQMNRRTAARHEGVAAFRYVELPGVDHFALIDPLSEAFEQAVWPALLGQDS